MLLNKAKKRNENTWHHCVYFLFLLLSRCCQILSNTEFNGMFLPVTFILLLLSVLFALNSKMSLVQFKMKLRIQNANKREQLIHIGLCAWCVYLIRVHNNQNSTQITDISARTKFKRFVLKNIYKLAGRITLENPSTHTKGSGSVILPWKMWRLSQLQFQHNGKCWNNNRNRKYYIFLWNRKLPHFAAAHFYRTHRPALVYDDRYATSPACYENHFYLNEIVREYKFLCNMAYG